MKKWLPVVMVLVLLVAGVKNPALAQGGSEEEPDFTVDWCVIVNGQAALEGSEQLAQFAPLLDQQFSEPGYYEVTIPINNRTFLIYIEDRGVDCATGDPSDVVRLWDDKMTMVIYRNPNYDIAFYRVNGRHIHTTPFWMLIGPFEPGQLIDEHETIGGTLRLYYLHDDYFQMNWYGPDGVLALEIPFTYPEPCVDGAPGAPRVCQ